MINQNTTFKTDFKTIIILITIMASFSATYFTLKAEIEVAKTLPELPISEKEFELKDELIRATIMSNAERLEKIEKKIDKIDERLYNINK
jgi:predicted permease